MLSNRVARRLLLSGRTRASSSNHRTWAASSVALTSLALLAVQQQQQGETEELESSSSYEYSATHPWLALVPSPNITSCDYGFLANFTSRPTTQKQNKRRNNLTRQNTVELLKEHSVRDDIDSKYKVDWTKPLGLGTFGGVYHAIHRKTGKAVAVKKIPKQCTEFATFQREMDALFHIGKAGGHPNLNTLHETFIGENGDDNYYLVLDLIEGGEMFDLLCEKGPFSEADAARLIRQVASAFAFLHGIGLVHSDIKPENILLTSKDTDNATIQLVDFGCAHQVRGAEESDDHQHRGTASTPSYCPPEVLKVYRTKHAHIEPSFDMWSLGVVLYVMLTGMHPFDTEGGSTTEQIESRVIKGEVPSLDDFEHISKDAKALVEGLMNMDPAKRLTASQLLEHPWVRGETASSRKIPQSDDRLRTYHRHKTSVGKHFFGAMLKQSIMGAATVGASDDNTRTNMCMLEAAFRQLDQNNLGFVSTKELHGDTSYFGADAKLSFSELSDVLSDSMANMYLPKGHLLYKEGEKGDSMYFLNSGSVEVTSCEGFVKERGAGEFFGEDALTGEDKAYANTVICKTPVHVIAISRDYYDKYAKADANVALTMAETDRLRNRERAKTILGLQKNMTHKEYKKGDVIFEQGSKGSILYIVEDGDVDIFRDGHKVRSLHKGEMTGEHAAYYDHKPYNVTAKCVGNTCKIGVLKSKDMHRLFDQNPSLKDSFHDIILRRDFKKAICAATRRAFPETEEDLRAAFNDMDTNKSGVLELEHLRRVMLDFDPSYIEDDIRSLLNSMDLSKTGSLSWTEFKLVFGMANEA